MSRYAYPDLIIKETRFSDSAPIVSVEDQKEL